MYVYRRYATPWEVLRGLTSTLPEGQSYLKPAVSIQASDQFARTQSDTECARHRQAAKVLLSPASAEAKDRMKIWGAPWKWRGVDNEGKPKAGFPLIPHCPWKSLLRFPQSHRATTILTPRRTTETNNRARTGSERLLKASATHRRLSGPSFDWKMLVGLLPLRSRLGIGGIRTGFPARKPLPNRDRKGAGHYKACVRTTPNSNIPYRYTFPQPIFHIRYTSK